MSSNSKMVRDNRRRKAKLIRTFKEVPCTDCRIRWPYYVMQLDHVRGKKLFNLSAAIRRNVSVDRILAEIEKCEAVCANCHSIRSHSRLKQHKAE